MVVNSASSSRRSKTQRFPRAHSSAFSVVRPPRILLHGDNTIRRRGGSIIISTSTSSSSSIGSHAINDPLPKASSNEDLPETETVVDALSSLAQTILALLSGDEVEARTLCGTAARKRELVEKTFQAYDTCGSGMLSVDEARALFIDLSRSIVTEIASSGGGNNSTDETKERGGRDGLRFKGEVARSHARRVLDADEKGTNTIERVATKLLLLADKNHDGSVDLQELAGMFDTVQNANAAASKVETFPLPLRALAGSLQLLPPTEGTEVATAASKATDWHIGVPGDDHTLRRVELEKGLSIVGLGRSADASAYFLPELGIVLDAGLHVKSLIPKTVLLTHGHRDHIGALPVHAQLKAKILAPKRIAGLVRKFLIAEAQLNYGNEHQTDEETIEALGEFDILPVSDGDTILLPKSSYTGSPQPLGVEVFSAPHKDGVPAVSYGLYRSKTRLKEEFAALPKSELGALIRKDVQITESYHQGLLFYTGDTTINLLRDRYEDILPKYKHIIHEVTFLGQPSSELDESTFQKGHTHYSQLHPWICAFPETTFVCVHWSLKYSRSDVLEFFQEQYGGVPKNVVLWI
jgi:ribonuclease Z